MGIKGFIDQVYFDKVIGWAVNTDNYSPVPVEVWCGDFKAGETVAEIFRPDLEKTFGNGGRFSFQLDVSVHDSQEMIGKEVLLKTALDGGRILHRFKLESAPRTVKVRQVVLNNRRLDIQYESENTKETGLMLFVNRQMIHTAKVAARNKGQMAMHIPALYFNGGYTLVELFEPGVLTPLYSDYYFLKPYFTPEKFLANRRKGLNQLSPKTQSVYRAKALASKVEQALASGSTADLANIKICFDNLERGYEANLQFLPIALPSVDKPLVSIVIPAYNGFNLVYHSVSSIILAQTSVSFEVILADDCSTDETARAGSIISNLVVSRTPENYGFLRNCNHAAKIAKGEFIVFLNSDTEVTNHWLDELLAPFADPKVGVTGSKLIFEDGTLQEAGGVVWNTGNPANVGRNQNPWHSQYNYVREAHYVSGASLCIRKELFDSIGQFSDDFAPAYFEDTDLCFKSRAAGFRVIYNPFSEVFHFEGKSNGTDLTQGLKQYQVVNARKFKAKWYKEFDAFEKEDNLNQGYGKDFGVRRRALVLDYATPVIGQDAGSFAAINEMKLLQDCGFKLTFIPNNIAYFGDDTMRLQRMGVEVVYSPYTSSISDFLAERGREFQLVYITRYYIAAEHLADIRRLTSAKVLFNNADLHFLRQLRSSQRSKLGMDDALEVRKNELDLTSKVDAVLTYNTTEKAVILSHNLRDDNIFTCPWVVEVQEERPKFSDRHHIAFLGGFNHHPNGEAVLHFVNDILPMLREKHPHIEFEIYGSHMPQSIKDLEQQHAGVKALGYVDDLAEMFNRIKVFVVPLLSGAGVKGKVLDAAAYGVPVVGTSIAFEGTGLTNGLSALTCDTAEEWVEAIGTLYTDEERWNQISSNASEAMRHNFSYEAGLKKMKKALRYLEFYV